MPTLATYSIYTMQHTDKLNAQAAQSGTHTLRERKAWVTGHKLWAQPRRNGQEMVIIFAAADVDGGLLYWARIDSVDVETETICTYSDLRAIRPERPKSSLRLRR